MVGGGAGGAGVGPSGSGSSGIDGSSSAAVRSSAPSGWLAGKQASRDREAVAAGREEGPGTGAEVAQERGRSDGDTRHTTGEVTSNASDGTASAVSGFPPKGGSPATMTASPTSFRSPVIGPRFADLPLPEMVHESLLLTDACRREICNALPTLAAGRAWVLLYR